MTPPLLFVSGEYPPDVGGVGDYTERLRAGLASLGWHSGVLSRGQVGHWDGRSLVWLMRHAPRSGVVHIQYQAGAFDLLGDVCLMPTLLRRVRPRVRVATTFHDVRAPFLFSGAGALRARAVRLLAATSHAVVAADSRDLSALGSRSPRLHHVPIGPNVPCAPPIDYDRQAFRAGLGFDPHTLAIVYFGLRNASKGLDVLLDAFSLVSVAQPNARLVLVGGEAGASDPTDRQTADRLRNRLDVARAVQTGWLPPRGVVQTGSLPPRGVVQTGWLPPPQLSAYLLAADIALLPYADGASPRRGSLLACAEHGLPIVSTLPAAPEVADAVYAVESDPGQLAAAVLEVARTPALAARLRTAAQNLAARVAWPQIAQSHVAIYEALFSAARPISSTRPISPTRH